MNRIIEHNLNIYYRTRKQNQMTNKKSKEIEVSLHEVTTFQEKIDKLKQGFFSILDAHLQLNNEASAYPFYLFLLIEHLALLWYLVRPELGIYQGVYFASNINAFLRALNPHQFLKDDPNNDLFLTIIVGVYLLVQLLLAVISAYAVLSGQKGEFFKYLRKGVNYLFLMTSIALSGPLLGLTVNLVYCNPESAYHLGQSCFSSSNIVMVTVGGFIGLMILVHILLLALIYYIRNPLNPSYMAVQNRYYVLSKSIFKILMPLYFTVDPRFTLSIVYMFVVTGLFGAYIFWHRLFSIHSYNQVHFYVEYFMEIVLFWMSASNLVYHYTSNGPVQEELSFIYTLLSAAMVAGLLLSIEAYAEDLFFKECLSGKIKKQSMEKICCILIHRLLNSPAADSRLRLKVYSKLLVRNGTIKTVRKQIEREERMEVYRFLLLLLEEFLEENNNTMLKTLRCYLSCHLGLSSHALHQSLQLQQQRLSLVEEFMLFQFRHTVSLFQNSTVDKGYSEFFKFYCFHQNFDILEGYVVACIKNSSDYWQELCQADPSLAKLRNLSTLYTLYQKRITQQYEKINEQASQNLHLATLYLSFLVATSSDPQNVLKMKEKLLSIGQLRSKTSKLSSQQLSGDEQTTIITLDTIGSNLGVVLNSNSQVKQLLGFEKATLMGKNITKLMPKIYTQLHNVFMLNFIRSQHANQTSVKRVTALNHNSLLVSINLSVRILSSSQSELTIVGFMKRLPVESFVGLVMYSISTGDVLGIDNNFAEMMNNRLSGKQVAQEQVRLNVLVPQLKMDDLEKEKDQQTFLEVGSSVQSQDAREDQKKVLVRLKSVKIYEGVKLGFLEITDIARYQSISSKPISSFDSHMMFAKENISNTQRRSSHPQDFSNFFQGQQACKDLDDSGRNKRQKLAIGRLLEDFVKIREGKGLWWALKALYCICVLGCMGTALYAYNSHADFLLGQKQTYLSLNKTIGIANYFAELNRQVYQIWNTTTGMYRCTNCSNYFSIVVRTLSNINKEYSDLSTTLNSQTYPLEYNQRNYYNFTYLEGVNSTLKLVVRPTAYTDAISIYVTVCNLFNRQLPIKTQLFTVLQMSSTFAQENGKLLLPTIAISAMNKYYTFITDSLDKQLNKSGIIRSLLIVVIVICFAGILLLASKLTQVNTDVVQVYSNLYLADITEVLNRCNRFLSQRGFKTFTRQSLSIKAEAKVNQKPRSSIQSRKSQSFAPLSDRKSISRAQLLPTQQPFIIHTQDNNEKSIAFEEQHTETEATNQDALLKAKEPKQPTVKIEEESSAFRIIIIMSIFLIVFGAVILLSYTNISSDSDLLKSYIYRLKVIGEIKKSVNYINYYAFRIVSYMNDTQVKDLLISQISTFFKLTKVGFVYLGDPRPILKDAYSLIQTIQQYLTLPNITSQQMALANYTYLNTGLQTAVNSINQLDSSTFYPQFVNEINQTNQNELIYTLLLIGFMCLTVVAIHLLHMRLVRVQSKHSLNMLRIMPSSLIEKNATAMKLISTK